MSGKLIVLEGIDGCGKSTQSKLLYGNLKNRGLPVSLASEPSHNPVGVLLRKELAKESDFIHQAIYDEYIGHLSIADRLYNYYRGNNCIQNLLLEGQIVITDRSYFSTLVYNFNNEDIDNSSISKYIESTFILPDLVIYLDITPELAFDRLKKIGKGDSYENIDKLREVKLGYDKVLSNVRSLVKFDVDHTDILDLNTGIVNHLNYYLKTNV